MRGAGGLDQGAGRSCEGRSVLDNLKESQRDFRVVCVVKGCEGERVKAGGRVLRRALPLNLVCCCPPWLWARVSSESSSSASHRPPVLAGPPLQPFYSFLLRKCPLTPD